MIVDSSARRKPLLTPPRPHRSLSCQAYTVHTNAHTHTGSSGRADCPAHTHIITGTWRHLPPRRRPLPVEPGEASCPPRTTPRSCPAHRPRPHGAAALHTWHMVPRPFPKSPGAGWVARSPPGAGVTAACRRSPLRRRRDDSRRHTPLCRRRHRTTDTRHVVNHAPIMPPPSCRHGMKYNDFVKQ